MPLPHPFLHTQVWSDDFSETNLERWTKESGAPAGTQDAGQLQTYTASEQNVWVEAQQLRIAARQEGANYTSGRLRSKDSFWPGMEVGVWGGGSLLHSCMYSLHVGAAAPALRPSSNHTFSWPLTCPCSLLLCSPQLGDGTRVASVHIEAKVQAHRPGAGLWSAFWLAPKEKKYGAWPQSGEVRLAPLWGCGGEMWDPSLRAALEPGALPHSPCIPASSTRRSTSCK